MARLLRTPFGVALGVGMCAAVARVSGTRLRNRGAGDADLARPLAGDGIVPDARSSATVGITIDAPPRAV
ncbi:MAG: hypothetical protein ACXVQS_11110, partial [Actinomycetota bacterium]